MNIAFFLTPKSQVAYLNENSTLRQGLEKMKFHGYTSLPVLSADGHYIGSVSEGDFLRKLLDCGVCDEKMQEEHSIAEILNTKRNPPVRATSAMEDLLQGALYCNFVPVIDDREAFIGIITRRAILQYFMNRPALS